MPQSERRNPERHHRATSVLEQTGRVQHFHTLQAYQRSVQKGTLFMDVHIYTHIYIYTHASLLVKKVLTIKAIRRI